MQYHPHRPNPPRSKAVVHDSGKDIGCSKLSCKAVSGVAPSVFLIIASDTFPRCLLRQFSRKQPLQSALLLVAEQTEIGLNGGTDALGMNLLLSNGNT